MCVDIENPRVDLYQNRISSFKAWGVKFEFPKRSAKSPTSRLTSLEGANTEPAGIYSYILSSV